MIQYWKYWEDSIRQHRPHLLSVAYRISGSLAEAEDIVQDSLLECAHVDARTIANHQAWLTRICSNKGLDSLKMAYKKRESYSDQDLPHPMADAAPGADGTLLLAESLTTSFLLIIERLSPEERVVYLLAEVFDYSFATIAQYLAKSETACRKIAERARKSVQQKRPRFDASNRQSSDLIRRFFELAKEGDACGLRSFLAERPDPAASSSSFPHGQGL